MSEKVDQLQSKAAGLGIGSYNRHALLCTGPHCCTPEEGSAAWDGVKKQIKDHQLNTGDKACYRTKVGCLRICCHGPTAVVYPEGTWYHGLSGEHVPRFVQEHLVEGKPIVEWIFATNPLGAEQGKTE